jgi:hypothetical protein
MFYIIRHFKVTEDPERKNEYFPHHHWTFHRCDTMLTQGGNVWKAPQHTVLQATVQNVVEMSEEQFHYCKFRNETYLYV